MSGFDDVRVIIAIASAVGAIVGGLVAVFNTIFARMLERRREQEKLLLEYISPLRTITEAILVRFTDMQNKIREGDKGFTKWFMDIKNILIGNIPPRYSAPGIAQHYRPQNEKIVDLNVKDFTFKRHANSFYYYPVSTLYLNLLFLYYSMRYRSARVYLTRKRGLDYRINKSLMAVRDAFSKNLNLYDVLQDSMGLFAKGRRGNIPLSYSEFIDTLLNEERNNWVFNLIDQYAEVFFREPSDDLDLQARIQGINAELTKLANELKL